MRMQAVVALSKLQSADEDQESDDDDTEVEAQRVADVLVDVLTHDSAAYVLSPPLRPHSSRAHSPTPFHQNSEVRRAALFNLIPSPESIPSLLLRAQDLDPINRRATFTHVFSEIPCTALEMDQRMWLMGRGLKDREENVKKGAKRLVGRWVDEIVGQMQEQGEGEERNEKDGLEKVSLGFVFGV